MSRATADRPSRVVIPLTTHHNLSSPISGKLVSVVPHGFDVEFTLENHGRFSALLEEAKDLVRQAGPNLLGRHLTYDGHSVTVGGRS